VLCFCWLVGWSREFFSQTCQVLSVAVLSVLGREYCTKCVCYCVCIDLSKAIACSNGGSTVVVATTTVMTIDNDGSSSRCCSATSADFSVRRVGVVVWYATTIGRGGGSSSRRLQRRQSSHPRGMDEFAADGANVHALVFGDVSPVPSLRSELDGVSFGVFLQFVPVGPDARFYPIAVFVAGGDGHDLDLVLKGYARGFGLELGAVRFRPARALAVAIAASPADFVVAVVVVFTNTTLLLVFVVAIIRNHDRFIVAIIVVVTTITIVVVVAVLLVVRNKPRLEGLLRGHHSAQGSPRRGTVGWGLEEHVVSDAHASQDAHTPVLRRRQGLRLHLLGDHRLVAATATTIAASVPAGGVGGWAGTVDPQPTQQPRSNVFRGTSPASPARAASSPAVSSIHPRDIRSCIRGWRR